MLFKFSVLSDICFNLLTELSISRQSRLFHISVSMLTKLSFLLVFYLILFVQPLTAMNSSLNNLEPVYFIALPVNNHPETKILAIDTIGITGFYFGI